MRRALRRGWPLVALALAGCSLVRPGPPVPAPAANAQELLDGLAARRTALTSLRARARIKSGVAGMWTRQAVLVQRPGQVRMDVMSPFGLALALGAQDHLLWAYSPSEQTRWEGEASPQNLARFLGAPVSTADLVDILMGLPPPRTPTEPPTLEREPDQRWRVTVPFDGGAQQIWFDPATREPRRAEERRGDTVVFAVVFDDWRDGLPHALDVSAPLAGSAARLAYDTVERNVTLEPVLFAPPSAEHVLPHERGATSGRCRCSTSAICAWSFPPTPATRAPSTG